MLVEKPAKRATRRLLMAGALVVAIMFGLAGYFLSDTPASDSIGQVKLVGPALPASLPVAAPTMNMATIPVAPSVIGKQRTEAQAIRLIDEARDADWAPRSEAAILKFLRGIDYLGGHRVIAARCASSTCEITGTVDPDPATASFKPVWAAIERDTAGPELRSAGLERTAATFDTGRSGDEFKLYYRRVDAL